MGKNKFRCLICNQEFDHLTSHVRASHPKFYQMQLELEIQAYIKRQQALEKLDPSIKQIPRGTIQHSAVGLDLQVGLNVQDGLGNSKVIPVHVYPKEVRDSQLDITEYQDVLGWERGQFLVTVLELLPRIAGPKSQDQETYRRQLQLKYQTALKSAQQWGKRPTPRREALATLRDYCFEEMQERQGRLKSLLEEQATIASGGFPCPVCERTFKNKSGVSNHIRKLHPDTYEKQIETQERATDATNGWQDYMIARRKLELFVSQGRLKEALEQLRIEVARYKEEHNRAMAGRVLDQKPHQFLID